MIVTITPIVNPKTEIDPQKNAKALLVIGVSVSILLT